MADETGSVADAGPASDRPAADGTGAQQTGLASILGPIGLVWTVSDLGYYFLLPALGLASSYNAAPGASTLYYALWVAVALALFRHRYRAWKPFENEPSTYLLLSLSVAAFVLFAAYLLPLLPQASWTQSWSPPEVRIATPWYFLPKSVEILFQQLLIVALVRALSAQQCSLRKIAVCCAALFGGTHALLAFGGVPLGYVARFMVAASAFGLMFPYLLLRVPNGFAYSYVVHWLYYAVTVAMPHIVARQPT
ncbi:MAG TPA: hypothetical protein VF502_13430 [Stellaceae bacterium]